MIRVESNLAEVLAGVAQDIREATGESTLRQVGFTGADIFRGEAKQNALAHAQTFTIHRNIIVKRLTEESTGDTRQVYLVTVRKGQYGGEDAFYWRFVERGHKLVPRNPNRAANGRRAGWREHRAAAELEYGSARVPAYPFMRPAYESKKTIAVDAMSQKLTEILARNAR